MIHIFSFLSYQVKVNLNEINDESFVIAMFFSCIATISFAAPKYSANVPACGS